MNRRPPHVSKVREQFKNPTANVSYLNTFLLGSSEKWSPSPKTFYKPAMQML